MKKIININLSGRLIPIEDSAYDILRGYTESLKRYFAHEEGKEEIISDIESRIAELFQDKIKKGAHCITDADVEEVMASIGRPEDFDANEEATAQQAAASGFNGGAGSGEYEQRAPRGRLFRNENDKILGGVCSGIANSLRIDPSLVRILFALITFGGFGLGFLIYIIMWIVLPKASLEQNVQKRLFRNPEEKVIGGVAGGIAAYFNVEVWIPRLVFAAPLILNIAFNIVGRGWYWFDFGSAGFISSSFMGTFLLAYIILWIVVPMASTTSERLQMKGQKVDLENIKNKVKEEMQSVKGRAEKFGAELKERAENFSQTEAKPLASEMASAAKPVASGFGHAIGVIFKAFFLFVAGTVAFALFVALIALFGAGLGSLPFKGYILEGPTQNLLAWGGILLFLGVPIIAFIVWLIRKIMGIKTKNSYLGYTFGALWLIGLFCAIALGTQIGRNFSTKARIHEEMPVTQPSTGKLIVKVADSKVKVYGGWFKTGGIQLTEDSLIINSIRLKIIKSRDSLYHVSAQKYSRGRNGNQAQTFAKNINYAVNQADSVFYLDNGFSIAEGGKFRAQQVVLTLEVPVGKKVRIDRSVTRRLGWFSLDDEWEFDDNWDDDLRWESGVEYVMTIGGLERIEKKSEEVSVEVNGKGYRYRGSVKEIDQAMDSVIKETEKAKQEILEAKEKELREQLKAIEEAKKSRTENNDAPTEEPSGEEAQGVGKVSGNLFSPLLALSRSLR